MPLGYVLDICGVIEYYTQRPDIQRALLAQGCRRRTVVGTDPGIFGQARRHQLLTKPEQIAELVKAALNGSPSPIPKKYPAFHASITRTADTLPRSAFASDPFDPFAPAQPFLEYNPNPPAGHCAGSDFVIDIDIKTDRQEAFRQGRKVLDLLDDFGVAYRIKFSGNAGPHIIIPAELFPADLAGRHFRSMAPRLMSFITSRSRATNVDGSFTSPGHFLRMAYSLNENTGLVSVPIPREHYDDFHLGMAEADSVAAHMDWLDVSGESREGLISLLKAAGIGNL
ncbi:MAG: hypothetical protein ACUVTZ_10765 [Armatimonadota bacterium]